MLGCGALGGCWGICCGGSADSYQVTIRNLDDELLEHLKARARLHHRSLEGELRIILAEAAKAPEVIVAEADRIKAGLGGQWKGDSTKLIREDRRR